MPKSHRRDHRRLRRLPPAGAGGRARGARRERRGASPRTASSSAACGGTDAVFLPRHGRGHRLSPEGINYRANIDALKQVGVTDLVSVSGLRLVQGKARARHLRRRRPVRRPHGRTRVVLLRQRLRRACLDGASGGAAARRALPRRGASGGHRGRLRRHLRLHGGSAILLAGRVARLQGGRVRRHRHDGDARGQARPRGRNSPTPSSRWSPITIAGTRATTPSTSSRDHRPC